MINRKLRLLIFDLDGTLVNAYPAIVKSFNYVMKKMGYRQERTTAIKQAVGWGDRKLLEPFVRKADLETALLFYKKHHAESLKQYAKITKVSCDILNKLQKKGYKLAIASNRPTKFSKILMKALNIYDQFDYILCGDRLKKGKPHPEILNKIVSHFNLKKDQTLYVGDMAIDAIAGRRAKVRTVIVLGGSSLEGEIREENPFKIIKSLRAITKITKELY